MGGGVYFIEGIALGKGISSSIFSVIYGPLWFLFMLICLYVLIPFFRNIASDDELTAYFLILGVISTFIIPALSRNIGNFSVSAKKLIDIVIENCHFYFATGYACYFVLGYWINRSVIAGKYKIMIGILGIASFIVLPIITGFRSAWLGSVYDYYGNMTLGILFESILIFSLAKDKFNSLGSRMANLCKCISKHSLGIYLIHKIIIDIFNDIIGVKWDFINTVVSIPLLTLCIFIISGLISVVLGKISVIRKIML